MNKKETKSIVSIFLLLQYIKQKRFCLQYLSTYFIRIIKIDNIISVIVSP